MVVDFQGKVMIAVDGRGPFFPRQRLRSSTIRDPWESLVAVDGSEIRRSPVEVGSFIPVFVCSLFFLHPRWWCRISSINSTQNCQDL